MAGRLTLWGAGEILRTFFSKTSEAPSNFYLALVRNIAPTPYISGSELDEPTADLGYARAVIPNNAEFWLGDSGFLHIISNEQDVSFLPAIADWGQIGYWALCNNDVSGMVYMVGEIEEDLYIYSGDTATLGAGDLVVELGPFFGDEDF